MARLIELAEAEGIPGYIVQLVGTDKDLLIQTDWDYPSIAGTFGWDMKSVQRGESFHCEHSGTDGTIRCDECGLEPGDFISSAAEWLSDHAGDVADDPGYFAE